MSDKSFSPRPAPERDRQQRHVGLYLQGETLARFEAMMKASGLGPSRLLKQMVEFCLTAKAKGGA